MPNIAAASLCGVSIERTPVNVFITAGTNAATYITITLAEFPRPSQTIANGIHARGGIGRNVKKIGFTNASIFLFAPIKIPSNIPKDDETRKPEVTKTTLCNTC